METVKLNRTGQRPVAFMGEEVFSGNTKDHDSTRWDVVRIFKAKKNYVIGIAKLTCWEEEKDTYEVVKAKNEDEVLEMINKRVPDLKTEELINVLKNKSS